MEDNKQVDDLVSMLDSFMGNGGGHMNVDVDAAGDTAVKTAQCSECSTGKFATACSVPTLMEGLDAEQSE